MALLDHLQDFVRDERHCTLRQRTMVLQHTRTENK
jgi:hypothetical protein